MPRPWMERSLYDGFWQALEQLKVAEEVGVHTVWSVEHHFLDQFFGGVRSRGVPSGGGAAHQPDPYRAGRPAAAVQLQPPSAGGRDGGSARHRVQRASRVRHRPSARRATSPSKTTVSAATATEG